MTAEAGREGGRDQFVFVCFLERSLQSLVGRRKRVSSEDKVEDKGQTEIMDGKRSQPGERG